MNKIVAYLLLAVASFATSAQQITGAGATFPYPVYSKWADAYNRETGVRLNYQSIGSGGGVRQILANTVNFGATDDPMLGPDLDKNNLFQFPTVVGGTVPIVNITGVKPGELKLTGAVLADIYLGKIKRWNDPAIQSLNQDLKPTLWFLIGQTARALHLVGPTTWPKFRLNGGKNLDLAARPSSGPQVRVAKATKV